MNIDAYIRSRYVLDDLPGSRFENTAVGAPGKNTIHVQIEGRYAPRHTVYAQRI